MQIAMIIINVKKIHINEHTEVESDDEPSNDNWNSDVYSYNGSYIDNDNYNDNIYDEDS